jgi:hypothetical protein
MVFIFPPCSESINSALQDCRCVPGILCLEDIDDFIELLVPSQDLSLYLRQETGLLRLFWDTIATIETISEPRSYEEKILSRDNFILYIVF